MAVRLLLSLTCLSAALTLACGGSGDDRLSLEEYYSKIEAIFLEQEAAAEAAEARYADRLDLAGAGPDEALEEAAEVLPDLMAEIEPIFDDAASRMAALEAPEILEEAHRALVDAYRQLAGFIGELRAGLESGETLLPALQALVGDSSGNPIQEDLEQALDELREVAADNGIEVRLPGDGGGLAGDRAPAPTPVVSVGSNGRESARFESPEFGISFDYEISPEEWSLGEVQAGGSGDAVAAWQLVRAAEGGARPGSEGAAGITIELFQPSPIPLSAEGWVRGNQRSNFGLGPGDMVETSVSGESGVAYSWSGLYEARSVAVLVDGKLWLFSATFIEDFAEVEGVFSALLASVQFR